MSSIRPPGRRSLLCLAALAFAGAGLAGRAAGQAYETFTSERASIVSRSRLRLGPLFVIPGMRLALEHDDNIYRASRAVGSVQDYSAGLGASIDAHWLATHWLTMSANYSPTYDFYFRVESERALNHAASLGGRLLLFGRFPVSGGYSYSRNKYRFSSEIDQRVLQEARGYHAGINFDTPRNSSVGLTFSDTSFSYESVVLPGAQVPLSQALDREEQNVRVDFYLPVLIDSQFYANFGFTDYVFKNAAGGFRDSSSYQSYVGVRFPILGRARGNIAIGYKKLLPRAGDQPGFSGLVGNTNVELRLGRINLRALYSRDIPFSYGTSLYYINDTYGGGISFYATQFLRLDYDYSFGGGAYPGPQSAVVPGGGPGEVARRDTYRSHSIGAVLRVLRNIGIGLSADIARRRSDLALQNMERTIFGIYLTYDF